MVAISYFDKRTTDWCAIALPKQDRALDWEDLKETLLRHTSATNFLAAKDKLARTRQTGSVQDHLFTLNDALEGRPGLSDEEKRALLLSGQKPEIAPSVRAHKPPTVREIIDLAGKMLYATASTVQGAAARNTSGPRKTSRDRRQSRYDIQRRQSPHHGGLQAPEGGETRRPVRGSRCRFGHQCEEQQ